MPSTLSATRVLFREPAGILLLKLKQVVEALSIVPSPLPKRRPGPTKPLYAIPRSDWPTVMLRVEQGETLRQVANSYNTSYETVRRVIRASGRRRHESE
ncbi:MAG: hypothetical protein NVSMB49_19200 [Ktedonobacteraceae bacterium]